MNTPTPAPYDPHSRRAFLAIRAAAIETRALDRAFAAVIAVSLNPPPVPPPARRGLLARLFGGR